MVELQLTLRDTGQIYKNRIMGEKSRALRTPFFVAERLQYQLFVNVSLKHY